MKEFFRAGNSPRLSGRHQTILTRLALVTFVLWAAVSARVAVADKINMSPDGMRQIATDVIVGQVVSISQRMEDRDAFRYTRYTAHVKISRVEKGNALHPGGVCDVRYWHRDWKPGEGPKPVGGHFVMPAGSMGTSGHRGMPGVGSIGRIYLARNAYDGFTRDNSDGGYNVIGPNGFESIASSGASPHSHSAAKVLSVRTPATPH